MPLSTIRILILDEQETFLLYKSIVSARQYKEIEFEEIRNIAVLTEIDQLRQLINKKQSQ